MSFTDQKPFVVTVANLTQPWNGYRDGRTFRCGLCGTYFKAGDVARWLYTNSIPGCSGNPFVCSCCDGTDVLDRWKALCAEWKAAQNGRFAHFVDPERLKPNPESVAELRKTEKRYGYESSGKVAG